MINIYRAQPLESEILTNIAIKSEAYWGYDVNYMENFKSIYKVTKEFISNNPTFVIKEDNNIAGFYGILVDDVDDNEISLEYLFIEPQYIGKGYGKLLWKHMIDKCDNLGIERFVIVTSPQAKGFYTKMGAILYGEVDSNVIKGRKIPRFMYTLKKCAEPPANC